MRLFEGRPRTVPVDENQHYQLADADIHSHWSRATRGVLLASPSNPTGTMIPRDELRAIKRYLATRTDKLPWLFVSERRQPMTRSAVNYLLSVAGESAGLKNVHPHMFLITQLRTPE